ncbi:MAG TPA: lipid-A-disaccharide synthase [Pseudomonadales bacterium]|nr:lipid-A-disaccharide synthase [Pseudomonadales bacterium]
MARAPEAPTIALLAGEASGDLLGASLIAAIRRQRPGATFVGVGGPRMRAEGLECLLPAERLTMNGFVEPVRRLPELLRIFRRLRTAFVERRVDAFVGIDFNVFNLLLERALKGRGLRTIHYVSPSVYAWRRGRVRRFRRAMDLMLTLYPFEPPLYRDAGVAAVFVGHPLADALEPVADPGPARRALGLEPDAALVLTLMPGSRRAELALMADDFLAAAALVARRRPGTQVLIALVDEAAARTLRPRLLRHPDLDARIVVDRSAEALAAADLVLVKSGTGTLEAMLIGRPMVVAYRLGPWTHRILRHLVTAPHFALPNILAGEALVPELIQDAATPARMADALLAELGRAPLLRGRFAALGAALRRGAADRAAQAVLRCIDGMPPAAGEGR